MVGIFSQISGGRGLRRAQSAIDVRNTLPPELEENNSAPSAGNHGFDEAVEFKPVEHPLEPLIRDQPVTCPLPEPSVLNDGRIWKERRTSTTACAITDLPVVKNGSISIESPTGGAKPPRNPARCFISSSLSAPEHNIIGLLEECNAPENQALN